MQPYLLCSLVFCLFLCPQSSWGLDSHPAPPAELLSHAQNLDLATSREWLALGHYSKTFFGNWKSAVKGGFFLAPDGATDPGLELETTISKMFAMDPAERQKIQCKYLARREFLARKLALSEDQLEPCEISREWIERLGATEVKLIFASSFMSSAGSSFGHTFLKLHNPKNAGALELTDYGVNYAARTANTEGALYAWNGLLGGFPGAFAMLPYHQMIKDYLNLEGRDLWEYKLNLTPEEVKRLLFVLLEIDGFYFDYYFLDDNCSFQILKLLELARPGLNLVSADELFVIPLDTVKRVLRNGDLISAGTYRPSLQSEFKYRLQATSRAEHQQVQEALAEPQEKLQSLSTPELDLAQYYLSLRAPESPQGDKNLRDQVGRVRATHQEHIKYDRPWPVPPTESPDSTSLSLGRFEKAGIQGGELEFRFAFHSLLSRDEGAAKWSELEVLSFKMRYESQTSLAYFEEIRLLNMLSTSAVNLFFRPLSWGVKVGAFQNGSDRQHLSPQFQAKVGDGLDLLSGPALDLRWLLFVKGTVQETPDLHLGPGVGGESGLYAKVGRPLRLGASLEKLFYQEWEEFSYQGELSLDLAAQIELHFRYQERQMRALRTNSESLSRQPESVLWLSSFFLL